ncbi:hypothetical protein [Frankia sp. Cj3]|uniref:hypothetical protein n=1 Tax=Frankia sp. Cj3 TaxID=2880976 RepID=UPI001EF5A81E|nr:hypothetical protein [Frankia sp. Cj3]
MAIPTVRTWGVSELLTSPKMNEISTALNFMLRVTAGNWPAWLVTASGTQSIPNATATALTFDLESVDNRNGHSTSSNTSRYTFQETGLYLLGGMVSFAGNTTGERAIALRYNNTLDIGGSSASSVGATDQGLSVLTVNPGTAGDYIELRAYQGSGGSLNSNNTFGNPRFFGFFIGSVT